jgi:hypothetical protein
MVGRPESQDYRRTRDQGCEGSRGGSVIVHFGPKDAVRYGFC